MGARHDNFAAHLARRKYQAIAIDIDSDDYYRSAYSDMPLIAANLDADRHVQSDSASAAVVIALFEHLEAPLLALSCAAINLAIARAECSGGPPSSWPHCSVSTRLACRG